MIFKDLFTIVVYYKLDINQLDVKMIFFYSLINQFVYIKILKRFEIKAIKNMIYKLLKALYGLK